MSGADPAEGVRRRPPGVTAVVVLTALAALLDLAVGVLVLVSGQLPEAPAPDLRDALAGLDVPVAAIGWVFLVLGVAQAVLVVLLLRGANTARLLLTLVLIVHQAYAWALVGESAGGTPLAVVTLVGSLVVLALLWSRPATGFFERHDERAVSDTVAGLPSGARADAGTRLLDFLSRLAVLGLTVLLTPGVAVDNGIVLVLAVVAIALAGWLLVPVFVRVAALFGWAGAIALALFANAAVIGLGLWLTPGVSVDSVGAVVVASWVYGAVMALLTWVFSISTRDYLTVHAVRMSRAAGEGRVEDPDVPGVVFVQLDGVPAPLLENEIRAGNLPTISRWVRSGTHTWTEWRARVPSTTPVSQAGLLHGSNDGIPAFRWFDRAEGRLVVANRPEDAALIERRLSDGRGLLADDGVSISNLFSGDAPTSLLSMSGLRDKDVRLGPSSSYAAFFTHPAGFVRAVVMSVGEMVKEVFQARRQERRDVRPRIHRGGSYVALRAVTNVLLRDLNVALVVEAMMRGARSVYVDFVDYDEIAHHAGVTRPESLAALYGLDEVLRTLETVARSGATPRRYHFVLLSDHGQSQGATFRQRYGQSLEDLVAEHLATGSGVVASTREVESWGPVNVLLAQLSAQKSVTGHLTRRALGDRGPRVGPAAPPPPPPPGTAPRAATTDAATTTDVTTDAATTDAATTPDADADGAARPETVVVGSGNLGGVWLARSPERLRLEDLEAKHPGLVEALATHPGIAFVVVDSGAGPVAIGAHGSRVLETGIVEGTDPLEAFGPDAAADYLRVARFDNAPDVYVNSLHDPVLDEVAAFEELVGCHGGVGGWQTRPLLVHPAEWAVDADLLERDGLVHGADRVHVQLVRWLERLGHRQHLPAEGAVAEAVSPRTSG